MEKEQSKNISQKWYDFIYEWRKTMMYYRTCSTCTLGNGERIADEY
jgi:hypothetical protein